MATITLTDGDFGSDATVVVGDEALYLPDPRRPGLKELVPFTAIDSVESVSSDRSGQVKHALKLGFRGLGTFGPLGLAAGALAVRKVKDVVFEARLSDGRRFAAKTDAVTYANLRAACTSRSMLAPDADESASRADEVIAKYLKESGKPMPAVPVPAGEPVPVASPVPTPAVRSATAPVAFPDDGSEPMARRERRTFGRRGL